MTSIPMFMFTGGGWYVGYRNAMWSLIGHTALGLELFLAVYVPLGSKPQSDTESSPEKSVREGCQSVGLKIFLSN